MKLEPIVLDNHLGDDRLVIVDRNQKLRDAVRQLPDATGSAEGGTVLVRLGPDGCIDKVIVDVRPRSTVDALRNAKGSSITRLLHSTRLNEVSSRPHFAGRVGCSGRGGDWCRAQRQARSRSPAAEPTPATKWAAS